MERENFQAAWEAAALPNRRALAVTDLLQTSREVNELLIPVQPDAVFRRALRRDLVQTAQQQIAHRLLTGEIYLPDDGDLSSVGLSDRMEQWLLGDDPSRRLAWGAAVGSAAAGVVGVLALYWRRRGKKAA